MAFRDLTRLYLELRERSTIGPVGHGNRDGHQKLLDEIDMTGDPGIEMSTTLPMSLPPIWVDIVEAIKSDMNTISKQLAQLERMYDQRIKNIFDEADAVEQDQRINALAGEVTGILKRCENRVKQVSVSSGPHSESVATLPYEERLLRLNVMRAMATKIQSLSIKFRTMQKNFLNRLKGLESKNSEFFSIGDEDPADALSGQQSMGFMDAKDSMQEREKEIIKIATSIGELATIFRELSVLLVEQGSILDSIDYNVEQSLTHLLRANEELVQANAYSKSTRSLWCILFLLGAIAICITILVLRSQ